ncbi:MAG: peroxiredoxin [Pirellulales bacterium]|nr:peroxiredoxin [Pirellulales bacterium]
MERVTLLITSASTALGLLAVGMSWTSAAELKPGDKAPDFTLKGSDGKTYRLSDLVGKQAVVLAWFPKAFTPGCTAECKSFRAGGDDLRAFDVAYFTASRDTPEKNAKFAESLGLDYPILSDPEGDVARAYGVTGVLRPVPHRWTFYIGIDGKILAIDKKVNTATHAADVARRLAELGVKRREAESSK